MIDRKDLSRLPDPEEVLNRCEISYTVDGEELKANCPFCDDKRKRFFFNRNKKQFFCHNCGKTGGVLQFFAELTGCDTKAAYEEFCKGDESPRRPVKKIAYPPKPEADTPSNEPVDVNKRHAVYSALMELLNLREEDRNDLLQRGMKETTIDRNCYRSLPSRTGGKEICRLLSQKFDLKGVPGFYMSNGAPEMLIPQYYHLMVPILDVSGHIQGFQIRRGSEVKDNLNEQRKVIGWTVTKPGGEVEVIHRDSSDVTYPKYRWFSTRKEEDGARTHNWMHYRFGDGLKHPHTFILTEGGLKSDVISDMTRMTVLGLIGISSQGYLPEALAYMKDAGYVKCLIAFDADMWLNKDVYRNYKKLRNTLDEHGMDHSTLMWDANVGKGLDDYGNALRSGKAVKRNETKQIFYWDINNTQ